MLKMSVIRNSPKLVTFSDVAEKAVKTVSLKKWPKLVTFSVAVKISLKWLWSKSAQN